MACNSAMGLISSVGFVVASDINRSTTAAKLSSTTTPTMNGSGDFRRRRTCRVAGFAGPDAAKSNDGPLLASGSAGCGGAGAAGGDLTGGFGPAGTLTACSQCGHRIVRPLIAEAIWIVWPHAGQGLCFTIRSPNVTSCRRCYRCLSARIDPCLSRIVNQSGLLAAEFQKRHARLARPAAATKRRLAGGAAMPQEKRGKVDSLFLQESLWAGAIDAIDIAPYFQVQLDCRRVPGNGAQFRKLLCGQR